MSTKEADTSMKILLFSLCVLLVLAFIFSCQRLVKNVMIGKTDVVTSYGLAMVVLVFLLLSLTTAIENLG